MCENFQWDLETDDNIVNLDLKIFFKSILQRKLTSLHKNLFVSFTQLQPLFLSLKRMNQKLVQNGMERGNFYQTLMKNPLLLITYGLLKKNFLRK